MDYNEALEFIHGTRWLGSKLGLRRVGLLLERMGNPQNKLRFIHVAGTNGKGSTCEMISRILIEAGYKTGLFISPYVLEFRERIQVNGKMIPEDELAKSVDALKPCWNALCAEKETPTEFEVVTAAAMDYFMRMQCDVVILEVGMGGRLDSTNIIATPLCSVITSIGMDHMQYLGDAIAKIAAEKCGIIKPHGITVCSPGQPPDAMEVIAVACKEQNNELVVPSQPDVLSSGINGSNIRYSGLDIHIPLIGAHQIKNAVTAVEAVKAAIKSEFLVTGGNIISGISKAKFPARFEVLSEKPLVIIDGAHNHAGAKALADAIKLLAGRNVHAVFCVMNDKDADSILGTVLPLCETVTVVDSDIPRAMEVCKTISLASKYCENIYVAGMLESAVIQPLAHVRGDDAVLIFGSLYFASKIRPVAKSLLKRFRA